MPSLSGLTQGTVYEGNAVELLENGAFFDAMFEEIRAATLLGALRDLPLEGRRARHARGRCAGRAPPRRRAGARAGRRRRRQEDGRGAARRLREAGCRLAMHHPRHVRNIGVFNERDHRKLVVVDGRVALVGGHCIVDSWLGDGAGPRARARPRRAPARARSCTRCRRPSARTGWKTPASCSSATRVPAARARGRGGGARRERQARRLAAGGEDPAPPGGVHRAQAASGSRTPTSCRTARRSMRWARRSKRGVDVRVMVPSAEASDMPMVQHAAHRNFDLLLAGGVRIFEYPKMPAAPEGDDGGRRLVRHRLEQLRRPLVRDQRRDHARPARRGAGRAARGDLRARHARLHRAEADAWARRGLWHRCKDNVLYCSTSCCKRETPPARRRFPKTQTRFLPRTKFTIKSSTTAPTSETSNELMLKSP